MNQSDSENELTADTGARDVSTNPTSAFDGHHVFQNPVSFAFLAHKIRFEDFITIYIHIFDDDLLPALSIPGVIHNGSIFKQVIVDASTW